MSEQTVDGEIVTQNASLLNALEQKFSQLKGTQSGYLSLLSVPIRNRLDALKNYSKETAQLNKEFKKRVKELEREFYPKHQQVFAKRAKIVGGDYEPSEEEYKRTEKDLEMDPPLPDPPKDAVDGKGIPEFWLTALKNLPPLTETITEEDEGALKHLIDVRYTLMTEKSGFVLEFEFQDNEYFTNKVLTKSYYLIDDDDVIEDMYERAEGCDIDWKEGKNLTVRVEVKKQRHKATNKTRTVKKTVPAESFFNFFKPPQIPEGAEEEDIDEQLGEALEIDFETGEMIKEKLIPDAVYWFTGKALEEFEEEYEDDDEEFDEEFDEDEDDDDDDEEDDEPAAGGATDKAPECKQQ